MKRALSALSALLVIIAWGMFFVFAFDISDPFHGNIYVLIAGHAIYTYYYVSHRLSAASASADNTERARASSTSSLNAPDKDEAYLTTGYEGGVLLTGLISLVAIVGIIILNFLLNHDGVDVILHEIIEGIRAILSLFFIAWIIQWLSYRLRLWMLSRNLSRDNKLRSKEQERLRREAEYQRTQEEHRRRDERSKKAKEEEEERKRASSEQSSGPKTEAYYGSILGLRGRVTWSDVRSRYIELVAQYHPDKVNHLGPKLKSVAEQEMKEINAAYSYFKKRYGSNDV